MQPATQHKGTLRRKCLCSKLIAVMLSGVWAVSLLAGPAPAQQPFLPATFSPPGHAAPRCQAAVAASLPRRATAEPARTLSAPVQGLTASGRGTLGRLETLPPAQGWNPQKTWVFIVGILQWQDSRIASFPQDGRRDADLVALFQAAGVPAEHITWLCDQQATLGRIDTSLHEMLARTRADDLLIVYYAGHGTRNLRDDAFFVPYEGTSGEHSTFWAVSELVDDIESQFRGSRALLMGDCCHSGGLAVEVNRRNTRVAYACLASANAHSASTGNWTFTDCVLDGFRGRAWMDDDHDGHVELAELAGHVFAEMAFVEEQMAAFLTSPRFDASLALAADQGEPLRGPIRVWAEDDGRWYKARVLAEREEACYVHYLGYSSAWDAWIGYERVRPFAPQGLAAGTAVSVEWNGRWYPAHVLRSYMGLHLICYDGYGDEWDEWVPPRRLRQ